MLEENISCNLIENILTLVDKNQIFQTKMISYDYREKIIFQTNNFLYLRWLSWLK